MAEPMNEASAPQPASPAFEWMLVLLRRKWLILGLPLLAGVVTAIWSLFLPPIFTANARILPPPQMSANAAALIGQINLPNFAGALGGGRTQADLYVGILSGQTIADNIVAKFDLQQVYKAPIKSDARKRLQTNTRIVAGKDGIILISVSDKDPQRAADMSNAYVEALMVLTRQMASNEAAQRRQFFENQFQLAKDNLAEAEIAARSALGSGGLVNIDAQARTLLEGAAKLRAAITVKEVQIRGLRTYAGEQNPMLRAATEELAGLKEELAKLEGPSATEPPAVAANGKSAERSKGLDNLRLVRNVKYYETIYEMMARQYELARVDESKNWSTIQVVDRATVPEKKSRPLRRQMVLTSIFVWGAIGILFVLGTEAIRLFRKRLQQSGYAERLAAALTLR